jgi:phosphoesterase RecJ-like protein
MQQAVELVRNSQRILLSGHLRADGDCLGAQSVLYHAFLALGKEPTLLLPDPPDERFEFLRAHTPWSEWQGSLPEHDLLVVCDCNQLNRLGAMGEAVAASSVPRIAVDHHPIAEQGVWTALFHDVTAAASGLLALRLAEALGVQDLPPAAHEAAFIALMTDTGWLQHSNADEVAWRAAAKMVAGGVDTNKVFRAVYQREDEGMPRGLAAVLQTTEYHENAAVALAWASRDAVTAGGGRFADTDRALDTLRAVGAVEAVAVLTEKPDGAVKVSFRSKTRLDVNAVARQIGGGGHARAAGATFASGVSLQDAIAQVREVLCAAYRALDDAS